MGQPGTSALQLLDPLACCACLVARFHAAGLRCPGCGAEFTGRQASTFAAGGRVHCTGCKRWSTYRSGTPLQGSTADDRQVALYLILSSLGVAPSAIAKACQISDDTVRRWAGRL